MRLFKNWSNILRQVQAEVHHQLQQFLFLVFLSEYILVFNHYLRRIRWFRKFLLVPDLNGDWQCSGQTTLREGEAVASEWTGEIKVTQSWSKILICLHTPQSESRSISASIYYEVGVGYRLLYQYNSDPNVDQIDLSKHSGSAEILFAENCIQGCGHYFADQHRRTAGNLKLTRR